MPNFIDITGQTISGYFVVRLSGWQTVKSGRRVPVWVFRCACGNEFSAWSSSVRIGNRTCKVCRFRDATEDLTGQTYGKLRVTGPADRRNGRLAWKAECGECNKIFTRGTQNLKNLSQCPCHRKRLHGDTNSPTYKTWNSMINRCTYPSAQKFARYGGRGIKVCKRWRQYENFLADMGKRPPDTSLDRIDNDGDYEPNNCRWATRNVQRRNMASNNRITFNGETLTLAEWAERTGIPRERLRHRFVRAGWSAEDTLTKPPKITGRPKQ